MTNVIQVDFWASIGFLAYVISTTVLIVLWLTRFKTKDSCKKDREQCAEAMEMRRLEIWQKIDQIYEWMITGIISVRRNDR